MLVRKQNYLIYHQSHLRDYFIAQTTISQMPNLDFWKQFQRKIYIQASPRDVFTALATTRGMRHWMLASATFYDAEQDILADDTVPSAGHTFSWQWRTGQEPEKGRVSSLSRNQYLSYILQEDQQSISFQLKRKGAYTHLILTQQHDFNDKDRNRQVYLEGFSQWTFLLTNLKSVLEGGKDLRAAESQQEVDLING